MGFKCFRGLAGTWRLALVSVLACALAGCAAHTVQQWQKAGATDADLRFAMGRCRTQAAGGVSAPQHERPADANDLGNGGLNTPSPSLQDMANYRHEVDDCLIADGWVRR